MKIGRKPIPKYYTCSEFSIVNIHANTTALSLMANNPNIHVSPSRGAIKRAALISDLTKTQNKSQKAYSVCIIMHK